MLQCSYTIPPGCANFSDSGERSSKPPDIPPLLQVPGNYHNDADDYEDDADDYEDDDRKMNIEQNIFTCSLSLTSKRIFGSQDPGDMCKIFRR